MDLSTEPLPGSSRIEEHKESPKESLSKKPICVIVLGDIKIRFDYDLFNLIYFK